MLCALKSWTELKPVIELSISTHLPRLPTVWSVASSCYHQSFPTIRDHTLLLCQSILSHWHTNQCSMCLLDSGLLARIVRPPLYTHCSTVTKSSQESCHTPSHCPCPTNKEMQSLPFLTPLSMCYLTPNIGFSLETTLRFRKHKTAHPQCLCQC